MGKTRTTIAAFAAMATAAAGLATLTTVGPAQADADSCDRILFNGNDGSTDQLWIADADGTDRIEVSSVGVGTDPTGNVRAVWSPDGTKIAWVGFADGDDHIYVANADGSGRINVSKHEGDDLDSANNPSFNATSDKVAFNAVDGSGDYQIYVVDTDGTDRINISDRDANPAEDNQQPRWSPDGAKIAWGGTDWPDTWIFVADPDGASRIDIAAVSDGTDPTANSGPVWSPDSDKIAWQGRDPGPVNRLWVANADGTERAEIITPGTDPDPTNSSAWRPAFSPDSTQIAFEGYDGSSWQIYVADIDGANRVAITDDGETDWSPAREAEWSPEGTRITFTGNPDGEGQEIFVIDLVAEEIGSVSDVDTGTDPTSPDRPEWRPRYGDVDLTYLGESFMAGAESTIAFVAAAECPTTVAIDFEGTTCLGEPDDLTIELTDGALDGSWLITPLDGEATFSRTGEVVPGLADDCTGAAGIGDSYPMPMEPYGEIVIGGPGCETDNPFDDTGGLSYGTLDISCIFDLGITRGTTDVTFSPLNNVIRSHMALFLARTAASLGAECDHPELPFRDMVGLSLEASFAIACIYDLGITTGTSTTTYGPDEFVIRWQMALFLQRLWEAIGGECDESPTPFTDIGLLSASKQRAVACIYHLGITTGTSPTTYGPDGLVTRQQMGVFLARVWRAAVANHLWA